MPLAAHPVPAALRVHQRKLPLLGESRPLALQTSGGARCQIGDCDYYELRTHIDEGRIAFAWTISVRTGFVKRDGDEHERARETRIFPDALNWYCQHRGTKPYPRTEDQVLAELLRTNKEWFTTTQLSILLNCKPQTVIDLVEARELKLVPKTDYGRGRTGVALITVASLREFFKSRRLPL